NQHHGRNDFECAGLGADRAGGRSFLVDDFGQGVVAAGTETGGSDCSAVYCVRDFLGSVRAGRVVADSFCRAQYQSSSICPPRASSWRGLYLSSQLVSIRAAGVCADPGTDIRLVVDQARQPRTVLSVKIFFRAAVRWIRFSGDGTGRSRYQCVPALAERFLLSQRAGRNVPQPSRLERHDQACPQPRPGIRDGRLVPLARYRKLDGRKGRLSLRNRAAADTVRDRRRSGDRSDRAVGDSGKTDEETDGGSLVKFQLLAVGSWQTRRRKLTRKNRERWGNLSWVIQKGNSRNAAPAS